MKELHRIYPKLVISPELRAKLSVNKKIKITSTSKKCKAPKSLRAADVDDAPLAHSEAQSPNAYYITNANTAPVVQQSSTSSIAAQTATFSGWVSPTLLAASSSVAAPLPAALAYAVQSTTYAGWVSADALNQSGPCMPQGTMGVFKAEVEEPFVYTREQAAQVHGYAERQQEIEGAVAQPSPVQSNAFTTTPAFNQSWTEPQEAYTAPVSTESPFFYSQQQQFQAVAQSDTPPAQTDNFLTQWTWTDGYTLDQACSTPTPPTSDFSPSSITSSISSPSSSSSSSWSPPTPTHRPRPPPTSPLSSHPNTNTCVSPEAPSPHFPSRTTSNSPAKDSRSPRRSQSLRLRISPALSRRCWAPGRRQRPSRSRPCNRFGSLVHRQWRISRRFSELRLPLSRLRQTITNSQWTT